MNALDTPIYLLQKRAKNCGPVELRTNEMHVKITAAGVRGYMTARSVKAGFYGIEIIFI